VIEVTGKLHFPVTNLRHARERTFEVRGKNAANSVKLETNSAQTPAVFVEPRELPLRQEASEGGRAHGSKKIATVSDEFSSGSSLSCVPELGCARNRQVLGIGLNGSEYFD
jgi:hypothetical protein